MPDFTSYSASDFITPGTTGLPRTGAPKAPTDVRIANMSLLLRLIQAEEGHSRATLTARTGLAKATVSTLVGELMSRGLVIEDGQTLSGTVGRPRTALTVSPSAVAAIGIDIGPDSLHATVIDLSGTVIDQYERCFDARSLPAHDTIRQAAELAVDCVHAAARRGSVAHTIALAQTGVIDSDAGVVRFSSPLQWRNVPLLELFRGFVREAAQGRCKIPNISIENDAKLAAWATYQHYAPEGIHDILYLSSTEGIAAGIVADGKILRGWLGESGEIGHMPVDPSGEACLCGRRGCLETKVSLHSLTSLYRDDDPINTAGLSQWERGEMLRKRFDAGDTALHAHLEGVKEALIRGVSIMVDVLSPQLIVLSGWMCAFGDLLIPDLSAVLHERKLDARAEARVEISTLGPWAASLGAAQVALNPVLDDPTTIEQKLQFPRHHITHGSTSSSHAHH